MRFYVYLNHIKYIDQTRVLYSQTLQVALLLGTLGVGTASGVRCFREMASSELAWGTADRPPPLSSSSQGNVPLFCEICRHTEVQAVIIILYHSN